MSIRIAASSPDDDFSRRVWSAIEQLAVDLWGSTLPPDEFYVELLRKGMNLIDAPAGAVWLKRPHGFLQQHCQRNMNCVGLDDQNEGRDSHNQLLRYAFEMGKPGILGPRQRAEGDKMAGNPTEYNLAVAPIQNANNQAVGLVEIFHQPDCEPQDLNSYTIQVAGYASCYLRNTTNR